MKIRRYLGFDCDSIQGFNNGRYIDDDAIEVKSDTEALQSCKDYLIEHYGTDLFNKCDVTDIENGYEVVTAYYDDTGNEMTREDWTKANDDQEFGLWSYIYVTYETEE